MDPLEIVAVAFGIVSVYLSVRENIWSWPTAIVNVALYILVFQHSKLYADMGLQVVYVGINAYGWYEWLYGGEGKTALKVSRVSAKLAFGLLALGVVVAAALGTIFARYTDASLPYVDSATSTTSLIAQWMLSRKLLENWAVWMAVDVVYIGMFIFKALYLTAGLYAVFFVLSWMGWRQWRQAAGATSAA